MIDADTRDAIRTTITGLYTIAASVPLSERAPIIGMIKSLNQALAVEEPIPPFGAKRAAAMAIYTAPFKYVHGYIYDSQDNMVADDGEMCSDKSVEGAVAARVRGWGRIGNMPNAAALQDEVGQMIVDALNAMYTNCSETNVLKAEVAELKSRLQASEDDALRYRWLRDKNADLHSGIFVGDETNTEPDDVTWVGSDLDAIIDINMICRG